MGSVSCIESGMVIIVRLSFCVVDGGGWSAHFVHQQVTFLRDFCATLDVGFIRSRWIFVCASVLSLVNFHFDNETIGITTVRNASFL